MSPAVPLRSAGVGPAGGVGDVASARKARGAFFTPAELCDYICRWAVRSPDDVVLEPSCGEAAFLTAAAARLDALGAPRSGPQLFGVEVHADSAAAARSAVAVTGRDVQVRVGDFFAEPGERRFDAVVGNPALRPLPRVHR